MMHKSDRTLPTYEVPAGVEPEDWSLTVIGAVECALHLSATDLHDLKSRTVHDDFSCLEGWTADGLNWHGVPTGTLLDRARPRREAVYGLVHGMDKNYACGVELARLRNGLLALELNGDPLLLEHGGPARLVLPNDQSECYENVKWVTQIEILDEPPTEHDTAVNIALSRIE